jgi:monoamine oxidase
MSLGDWVSTLGCSPVAKRAIEAQFENTNGAPVHKQSFLANLAAIRGGALHGKPDDYFTQSETVKCEQGNQMLATRLAEEIVHAGGVVATSTPISSIKLDRDKVTVTSASGVVTEADYVVLAIPPSLWPSGGPSDIRIDPPIPPEFHMSMGLAVKYLSAVKTRFWFGAGLSPNAVSDTIGVTWDGTDNQLQLNGEPVELSLFAGGPAAASAIDLLKRAGPEGLDAFYAREIGKLYGGYAGNRASAQFVCWPQERWTRAGYSCPAPGEATRIGPFLNQPFHDRLFFAGEHCCLPFFGYMEGALQSGEATAFAIARSERLA